MLNKSYSYLIPLLNQYCRIDGDFYVVMDNVYTNHQDGDVGNIIILSYYNSDYPEFLEYIEELKHNELCQDFIENSDNVSLIFKFPDEFLFEYNCYKEGKFSQFRKESKDIILKYILDIHKGFKSADKLKKVLYKDEVLRRELEYKLAIKIDQDLELSSKPDKELETFYYDNEIR